MESRKVMKVEGVGEILFEKSKRASRINISIKPFRGVRVAVPYGTDFAVAENFLLQKIDWIRSKIPKMEKTENALTIFDEQTSFTTKRFTLKISSHQHLTISARIHNGKIDVKYPDSIDVKDDRIQNTIRKAIEATWKIEAKAYLPERLDLLAQKFGFKYKEVKISSAKTRWGSCSGRDNINLSLHLMRLPEQLIDYVLLHELCHTIEKNHGPRFWALLDKVSGDARGLDNQVNQYKIKVY